MTLLGPVQGSSVLILCKLFGHRRCTRHAYHAGATWVSVCRRCGVKLKRVAPGKWIARRRPNQHRRA